MAGNLHLDSKVWGPPSSQFGYEASVAMSPSDTSLWGSWEDAGNVLAYF
jgi:hypothetical protein